LVSSGFWKHKRQALNLQSSSASRKLTNQSSHLSNKWRPFLWRVGAGSEDIYYLVDKILAALWNYVCRGQFGRRLFHWVSGSSKTLLRVSLEPLKLWELIFRTEPRSSWIISRLLSIWKD
jgi:hypothetical protein